MPSSQRVVLVEDEQQQRDILTMLLESEGYSVIGVESAESALAEFTSRPASMVITDVKLPDMDGFTLFEKIRSAPGSSSIPFIFITGYNDPKTIDKVRSMQSVQYITKPFDLEQLVDIVKKSLPPIPA